MAALPGLWSCTIACLVVHWCKEERLPKPLSLLRMRSDLISVSGNAVFGNQAMGIPPASKPWTLLTATLAHSGRSHLVNNLLMLWVTGPALEELLGPCTFVVLFFLLGAVGWLCRLLFTRIAHAEQWNAGIAQWSSSLGCSPASYGLALLASVCLSTPGADNGVGTAFGLPPWAWFASTFFVPKFLSDSYGVNLVKPGPHRPRSLAIAATCAGASCLAGPWLVGPTPRASTFMLAYLINCAIAVAIKVLWFGSALSGSDNESHLGGALAGTAAGFVLGWWGGSNGRSHMNVETVLCLAYLTARVVHGCVTIFQQRRGQEQSAVPQ